MAINEERIYSLVSNPFVAYMQCGKEYNLCVLCIKGLLVKFPNVTIMVFVINNRTYFLPVYLHIQ